MLKKKKTATVSVIIPTLLAQPEWLRRTLTSLTKQDYLGTFSVFVVVNAGQAVLDAFLPTLKLPQSNIKLVWLVQGKNTGFTHAVNRGILASKSKLVALVNDDVWLTASWLTEIIGTWQQTGADMIASTIFTPKKHPFSWPMKKTQWQLDSCGFDFAWRGKAWPLIPNQKNELSSPLSPCWDNWLQHVDLLGKIAFADTLQPFGADGAAALYTRKLFKRAGLFKQSFFAYLEDVELALRARRAGFVCRWSPKALAYHGKHATSTQMGNFKAKQDVKNWWRMLLSFPFDAWWRFGVSILLERLRNVSGLLKQLH